MKKLMVAKSAGFCFGVIASQEDFAYFSRLAFNEDVMVPNMGRVFTQEEAEGYFAWLLEANRTCPESGCYKVFAGEDPAFIGLGSLWVREDGAEIDYMVLPAVTPPLSPLSW